MEPLTQTLRREEARYDELRRQRKVRLVYVAEEVLVRMLRSGRHHYRTNGIPEDAIYFNTVYDVLRNRFAMAFMHESFAHVRCDVIPDELPVTFSDHEE